MSTPQENDQAPAGALSDDERARAFAGTMVGGRATYSKRTVTRFLIALFLIGISGSIVEILAGRHTPAPVSTTSSPPITTPVVAGTLPSARPNSILGIKSLRRTLAPAVSLTTSTGAAWSLTSQRGHVIILTFYDAACQDICPVLGAELRQTIADLGSRAAPVQVAIINTNPHLTAPSASQRALADPGLSGYRNVVFLNGPLGRLIPIWTHYGITVSAARTSSLVTHTNALYLIDTTGHLVMRVTPFANQTSDGRFRLDQAEMAHFASALARVTISLSR